jgi:phosphohistidine phosphatase
MKLYILRHGLAEVRDPDQHVDDSERPLTSKGKKRMLGIARGLKALGMTFDAILSSPYLRARQTADIVVENLGIARKLIVTEELAPDGDPQKLVERLSHFHRGAFLLVGHEPYLSSFISVLLTGKPDLPLELKKGGLCRLRVDTLRHGRCATLETLLTPRQLAQCA